MLDHLHYHYLPDHFNFVIYSFIIFILSLIIYIRFSYFRMFTITPNDLIWSLIMSGWCSPCFTWSLALPCEFVTIHLGILYLITSPKIWNKVDYKMPMSKGQTSNSKDEGQRSNTKAKGWVLRPNINCQGQGKSAEELELNIICQDQLLSYKGQTSNAKTEGGVARSKHQLLRSRAKCWWPRAMS